MLRRECLDIKNEQSEIGTWEEGTKRNVMFRRECLAIKNEQNEEIGW
jgi:hypothetical protein